MYIVQHDLKIYRYHMPATTTGEENETSKYGPEAPDLKNTMLNQIIIPTKYEYILKSI